MTGPGGGDSNFQYSDDSVIAKLSFDVPAQALTDITQLTSALSAMATQQEYASRSAGTWLEYMQQIPQILDRTNQAYRETITNLERMSYVQNEMGGHGGGVMGGAGGSGGGGYSTAAPGGYVSPFNNPFGMGMTPDLQSAQAHMQGMASQDPRMYANMMAARGQAVNPALMGMMGGAVTGAMGQGGVGGSGGGMGWGAAAPGSLSSQPTQASRASAAPPNPAQGGQSTQSEPQNIPGDPPPDAPSWQKNAAGLLNSAQQMISERSSGGPGRQALMGMAAAGLGGAAKMMGGGGGGGGGGGEDGSSDGGGDGGGGRLGGLAKGAGAVGAGIWAFNKAQDIGEGIQKYTQLGAVQGGDAGTGVGYEAQARILALNPFITTSQARQAMQMALTQGFKGGEYDTIQDYMLSNFKDMGVQFKDSMTLARSGLDAGQTPGDATKTSTDALKAMFQLSREGGASFESRTQQQISTVDALTDLGFSPESANRAGIGFQEGYGDKLALRDSMGQIGAQGAASPMLMQIAAQQSGLGGQFLPGALAAGLSENGIDADKATELGAKQIASYVKGMPNRLNRIAAFQQLMGQQGVQLDWKQAEAYYDKVTGEKAPSEIANERVATANEHDQGTNWGMIKDIAMTPFRAIGNVWDAAGDALSGNFSDAWGDLNRDPHSNRESTNTANDFASHGRAPVAPPTSPQQAPTHSTVATEGNVNGTLNITVDQNGRVSAPQQIQLSGNQRSVNAGYGSAQLNNVPPSDPSFGHSYNGYRES